MVICVALLMGSAADADTTAVYHAKLKSLPLSMTVEIADNGNVRYQMSTGQTYGLNVGGIDYIVDVSRAIPVVDRADDLLTAQKEAMAAFMPVLQHHEDTSDGPQLIPIGNVTINGRSGQAFGYKPNSGKNAKTGLVLNQNPGRAEPSKDTKKLAESELKSAETSPVLIISHDPDLAQLGKVMAKQFGTSLTMLTAMIGSTPSSFTQMDQLLHSGAPLLFAGMEFQSVNHAKIDAKRFELPAQPETLDQIRARMKPLPVPPTASPKR